MVMLLVLAVFPGRSVYRHLKEKHSVAQAQVFFSRAIIATRG